jgi:hypothetical protein
MKTPFGLGDLAYYLFRPVVYLIDWVWSTDLRDCEKCKRRRKLWNSYASFPAWLLLVTTAILVFLWVV